ncbi:MAG: universal stress protein [Desulfobacteraceae bacterium]|nr:universal stress protein [Desulfobacteraceae bacterium]
MKILVGCKLKVLENDLMKIAVQHAKAFDGTIMLVTSMVGGEKTEQEKLIEAEKNLESIKKFFDDHEVNNETHLLVRGQEAAEDIVSFAKEKQVDEIVIGVKNKSKVGKLIFGSTAQYIILNAQCPVVCVK